MEFDNGPTTKNIRTCVITKITVRKSLNWYPTSEGIRIHAISDFEYAVFNEGRWDSSVINAIDASLLSCICSESGVSEQDTLKQSAADLDLECDASFLRYGREALRQMEEFGLIFKEFCIEDQ